MALILYICLHRRAHFLLENPVNSLVGPSKGLIHLYIKFTIHSTIVHFCCNTWDIPSPSSSTTLDVERLVWGQHMAWNVWGSYMETSTSCFLQPVCGEVVQDSVWKRTPITIFKMFCGIRMHYYINIAINIPVSCARKGSPLKSIWFLWCLFWMLNMSSDRKLDRSKFSPSTSTKKYRDAGGKRRFQGNGKALKETGVYPKAFGRKVSHLNPVFGW